MREGEWAKEMGELVKNALRKGWHLYYVTLYDTQCGQGVKDVMPARNWMHAHWETRRLYPKAQDVRVKRVRL